MSTLNKHECTGAGLAAGSALLVGGSVAASSLLDGYPVLGGQAVRYLAAGILLAAWARLQRKPLPRPAGREWAWLAALAAIGLAGCSALMIQATRVADPASVGVIIGAAPLVIIVAAAITAGRRPTRRVLLAAAVVTAGSVAAQLGGAAGPTWSPAGLLWSAGALGGVVGSSLLAAPLLPRLGALAVTVYACGLAWDLAASHRCRDPFCWRAADPAHTHRDPAGRAGLPHDRDHRPGVRRLVQGNGASRGGPHRTVQRADPCHVTGRRRSNWHRHHHAASAPRRPRRPRRRAPWPQPCSAGSRWHPGPGRSQRPAQRQTDPASAGASGEPSTRRSARRVCPRCARVCLVITCSPSGSGMTAYHQPRPAPTITPGCA